METVAQNDASTISYKGSSKIPNKIDKHERKLL